MSEVVEQIRRDKGSWVECVLEDCNMMFFRHVLSEKYYDPIGDKIGVCPLCIHRKKMQNNTLPKRKGNVNDFVHHAGTDAKPEANTL